MRLSAGRSTAPTRASFCWSATVLGGADLEQSNGIRILGGVPVWRAGRGGGMVVVWMGVVIVGSLAGLGDVNHSVTCLLLRDARPGIPRLTRLEKNDGNLQVRHRALGIRSG